MDSDVLILLAIYVVPFLVAALMPGWKSLGVVAALTGLALVWMVTVEFNRGGGLAQAITLAIYGIALIGAVAGVVTRAITLLAAQRGASAYVRPALTLIGLLVPMAFLLASPGFL